MRVQSFVKNVTLILSLSLLFLLAVQVAGATTYVYPYSSADVVIAASDSSPSDQAVADYVCTGHDDDLVMQNAVNATPDNGVLYFTPGLYKVDTPNNDMGTGYEDFYYAVHIVRRIDLEGTIGAKIIFDDTLTPSFNPAAGGPVVFFLNGSYGAIPEGITINGFWFDGDKDTIGTFFQFFIWVQHVRGIWITNNYITDAKDPIYGDGSEDDTYYGLHVNNNVLNLGGSAFDSTGECGISLHNGLHNSEIRNNTIKDAHHAIFIDSTNNTTVADNIILNSSGMGIYLLDKVYGCTITNNTIIGHTDDNTPGAGIYCYTTVGPGKLTSDNNTFSYNNIIDFYAGATLNGDNNTFKDNYFNEIHGVTFNDLGTNTVFYDNYGDLDNILQGNYYDEVDDSVVRLDFSTDNATYAKDTSGNSNHAQLAGSITKTQLDSGTYMYEMDGSNDKMTITNTDQLNFASSFTAAVWFRTDYNVDGVNKKLFMKYGSKGYVFTYLNGTVRGEVKSGATNYACTPMSGPVNDSQWHYAVFVVDDAADMATTYVDGVATGTKAIPAVLDIQDTANLVIANNAAVYMDMDILMFEEWDKALTPTEITNQYNAIRHRLNPNTTISHNTSYTEAEQDITTTVSLTNPAVGACSIVYAIYPCTAAKTTDYTSAAYTGTLSYGVGDQDKDISIHLKNDGQISAYKQFSLILYNPVNMSLGSNAHVYTINEIDDPVLTIAASSTSVTEADTTITLTITKTGPNWQTTNVTLATADGTAVQPDDYTSINSVLGFTTDEYVKTVALSIKDDMDASEGPEDLYVELSAPTGNSTLGDPYRVRVVILQAGSATSSDLFNYIVACLVLMVLGACILCVVVPTLLRSSAQIQYGYPDQQGSNLTAIGVVMIIVVLTGLVVIVGGLLYILM